uniref:Uncharacterized protein n=1 Tax=Lotus japonicus TaxID=34305 RepID=I3S3B5_LOTJA|nr:unknown [Lotus japonicus]
MTENNPKTKTHDLPLPEPPPSSSSSSSSNGDHGSTKLTPPKRHFNPPESEIPDAATLKDQWRYAIKQYSKWYSHAWGTAILAGGAFFALGWLIKGENPIPSFRSNNAQSHDDGDGKPPS